jgi:hypothetical protein
MSLWARAISIGAAVVVAALLLRVAPPPVVLAVFVAAIVVAYVAVRRLRGRERASGGGPLGLRREATDPFGILGYPLALFGRAGDPEVEDVLWGRWRSLDVHAFALSFRPPSIEGHVAERTSFACAMARVAGPLPGLVVEPEPFRTLLPEPPPGAVVQIGDPALDTRSVAWAEDEAFARAVLDASTRDWLRSLDQAWGMEVRGQIALVYGPQPASPDVVVTLEVLRELLGRLPSDLGASPPPAV